MIVYKVTYMLQKHQPVITASVILSFREQIQHCNAIFSYFLNAKEEFSTFIEWYEEYNGSLFPVVPGVIPGALPYCRFSLQS